MVSGRIRYIPPSPHPRTKNIMKALDRRIAVRAGASDDDSNGASVEVSVGVEGVDSFMSVNVGEGGSGF